jgi:hypothetical protein
VAVKKSGILKIAGLSLVGFCAVSIGVDRENVGPITSQVAGFCGAFLGGLAAHRRNRAAENGAAGPPAWSDRLRQAGYVHLPALLPSELITAARDTVAENLAAHYDESRLVEYNHRSWCPEIRDASQLTALIEDPAVRAVCDAALGKGRYDVSQAQIAIRKAHSAPEQSPPSPHIDGIPTPDNGLEGNQLKSFTALLGIFLTEASSEFAGNFTVWPGSHTLLENYFATHGKSALAEGMPAIPLGEPTQLLCQPGDVVFCHYQLAHGAAVNTSDRDRIAVFFRLSFKSIEGPGRADRRWYNLTHLWNGWRL